MHPHRFVVFMGLCAIVCAGAPLWPGARARAQDTTPQAGAEAAVSEEDVRIEEALRLRRELVPIHRVLGISTWVSMAATAALGWIRFGDEYGFHGSANGTACENGDAIMQDSCTGTPWPHLIAGIVTTSLYATTAGISFAMPTPASSPDARLHGSLRWLHMGLMLATLSLGVVSANLDVDFSTRQALAVTHMALATSTLVVLSAAAAVVLF